MSKYFVGISETTKGWVEVEADNVEQAKAKAYEAWSNGVALWTIRTLNVPLSVPI